VRDCGFLLSAAEVAFLSSVNFSSGRFHVWGTVIRGLFPVFVRPRSIVGGRPFTWAEVLDGTVLVAAVSPSTYNKRMLTT